jgi:multiple sugar transport system permease protein
VAAGIVWQLIFSEASYGLLNSILRDFGLRPVAWLSNPQLALWSAVIANIWRGTAFSMILLYAGLVVIPRSLYEAAEVDGATAWRQLWYITLPQLRPIMLINIILISIFTLNTFDMILALTGGGPGRATEVLALYAYNVVFRNFDLSNGSVLAVVLLGISVAFTFFYVRLLPKESDQ